MVSKLPKAEFKQMDFISSIDGRSFIEDVLLSFDNEVSIRIERASSSDFGEIMYLQMAYCDARKEMESFLSCLGHGPH